MAFEDELGNALRRVGDGFAADEAALAAAGERHGRRLAARRRAVVVGGSALALALIGVGGGYTSGLLGGGSGSAAAQVLPADPVAGNGSGSESGSGVQGRGPGSGAVSAAQLVGVLEQLLPGGTLTGTRARGTGDQPGPMVSGVYDDGKGRAAVAVGLSRVDPKGRTADAAVTCQEKSRVQYDGCEAVTLPDGARLMVFQGYERSDRSAPTKRWEAVLVTVEGFRVEVQEWNAPAQKDEAVSRQQPPLDGAGLKAVATSPLWLPALKDLPAAAPEEQRPPVLAGVRDAAVALQTLLPADGVTITKRGGTSDYAYAVLDDGRGGSLVEANVQTGMGELLARRFAGSQTTVLPDGTRVRAEKTAGEKGGAGVVMWTVDTLRTDGRRVVVSAFNTADQNAAATRAEPLLTIEQLRKIALDPRWLA
ncbi:hypothetical protein ACFV2Q_22115 [Streptomyces sp. NPDC059650]|uniref:hypothetical protein n=1 Tax=Streptomyces sp. NPDC059650 TaxID=3346896 RepID=UPI0036BA19C7